MGDLKTDPMAIFIIGAAIIPETEATRGFIIQSPTSRDIPVFFITVFIFNIAPTRLLIIRAIIYALSPKYGIPNHTKPSRIKLDIIECFSVAVSLPSPFRIPKSVC